MVNGMHILTSKVVKNVAKIQIVQTKYSLKMEIPYTVMKKKVSILVQAGNKKIWTKTIV